MLLLVLGNNFVVLYFGWEGVGLASYLLIAWYTERPAAATAAKKAFIMNRVGDAGLAIAIFLMFSTFGVVSFAGVFGAIGGASEGVATALGAAAPARRVRQVRPVPAAGLAAGRDGGPDPGLRADPRGNHGHRRRLPDRPGQPDLRRGTGRTARRGHRRRGHAAVRRDHRRAKDDIKKVLAYSTVSQIGYMFLAVGLGPAAYALGILHLLTHGFFKAGLFLGAGSVMHGMNDQVDMRRFGGLWKVMPITFWTFTAGYLALIGFPVPVRLLHQGPDHRGRVRPAGLDRLGARRGALFAAGLTAFYMTRLMIMTFFGERRWTDDVHPHESPPVMTVPMLILAVGSVGRRRPSWSPATGWCTGWSRCSAREPEVGCRRSSELSVSVLTVAVRPRRDAAAWFVFGRRPVPTTAPARVSPVTVAARRNLYADAFNETVFMRPGMWLDRFLVWFDNRGVDGAVNGVAAGLGGGSGRLRRLQTGFVRSYALSMLGGSLVVVASLLAVRFV